MRNARKLLRKIAAPLLALAVGAGLSVVAATPASASTIKDGWIQICPWGNYRVHLEYTLGGPNDPWQVLSPTLNPGADCWWGPMPAGNQYAWIHVVGHFNTSSNTFLVGRRNSYDYETMYNGRTGIGFAAQGTTEDGGRKSWYTLH
ncbi:hypothetical protein [Micromonospora yangpuensis]|uniref:Peptidase inhibitor family I36 n=1 Tax=Micromonospora yangpuensis TaxID=683228 RepID=A0A1C6UKW8_9ACTN|nr:hypothetical protein [Micromonospora yangpuensis]GGM17456.1 hypothetical protein GCM10012279_39520 [Micromonospora yangpuensis]SCL54715.1 hypothetical protein GA0070617_2746 [Micromonospora yangpuensis]